MGNLAGKTLEDIQKDELKNNPLNTLTINASAKTLKLNSPKHKPQSKESPAPKQKKIISYALPSLQKQNPFQLTPIPSNSHRIVIPAKMIEIAECFWKHSFEKLSMKRKLEVGWSIYVGMLATDSEIQNLFNTNCETIKRIESISLKFLDMMGFLIRTIKNENNAKFIQKTLRRLGTLHDGIKVKYEHYLVMIRELHQTFSIYFKEEYSEQIRFSIDEIYFFAVQCMTGKDLKIPNALNDTSFLQSLSVCLESSVGRSMLFRYLQHLWCDEMVMFLHLVSKYKTSRDARTRYMIAKHMVKTCIDTEGSFTLRNISDECKQKIMSDLVQCKERFEKQNKYMMHVGCFEEIEYQIHEEILKNHWKAFRNDTNAKYTNGLNDKMLYIE